MQSLSLKVIRFTNDEVCEKGEDVVKKIRAIVETLNT